MLVSALCLVVPFLVAALARNSFLAVTRGLPARCLRLRSFYSRIYTKRRRSTPLLLAILTTILVASVSLARRVRLVFLISRL